MFFAVEFSRWIAAEALEDLDPLLAPSVRAGTEIGEAWHTSLMADATTRLRRMNSELATVFESRLELVDDEITKVAISFILAEVYERCGKPAVAAAHRASLARQSGTEIALLAMVRMSEAIAKLLACKRETVKQITVPVAWAALLNRWICADAIEPYFRDIARELYFGNPDRSLWFCGICQRAVDAARRDDPALVTTDTSALFKLEAPARALLVGHQLTELRAELGVDSLTIDFGSAWRVVDRLRYTLAAIAIEPAANDGAGVSV